MSQQRLEILAAAVVLATSATSPVAMAADGLDRYGGRARTTSVSYGQQPGDRMLTWPGKLEPASAAATIPSNLAAWPAPAFAPGPGPVASGAYSSTGAPTAGFPTGASDSGAGPRAVIMAGLAPPVLSTRPFVPATQVAPRVETAQETDRIATAPAAHPSAAPVAPPVAPAAPPAAKRPVVARAAPPVVAPPTAADGRNGDAHVRLYSLHRDYGMEPDAVPLPPSTFTTSADLAGQDQAAATPQPSPKTPQGRTAITAARIADGSDGEP